MSFPLNLALPRRALLALAATAAFAVQAQA